jgi:hypothetical protein
MTLATATPSALLAVLLACGSAIFALLLWAAFSPRPLPGWTTRAARLLATGYITAAVAALLATTIPLLTGAP